MGPIATTICIILVMLFLFHDIIIGILSVIVQSMSKGRNKKRDYKTIRAMIEYLNNYQIGAPTDIEQLDQDFKNKQSEFNTKYLSIIDNRLTNYGFLKSLYYQITNVETFIATVNKHKGLVFLCMKYNDKLTQNDIKLVSRFIANDKRSEADLGEVLYRLYDLPDVEEKDQKLINKIRDEYNIIYVDKEKGVVKSSITKIQQDVYSEMGISDSDEGYNQYSKKYSENS